MMDQNGASPPLARGEPPGVAPAGVDLPGPKTSRPSCLSCSFEGAAGWRGDGLGCGAPGLKGWSCAGAEVASRAEQSAARSVNRRVMAVGPEVVKGRCGSEKLVPRRGLVRGRVINAKLLPLREL